MSDTFDHYADAMDNYMMDDWDGIDPNPYMPNIGGTPQDVAIQIGTLVRGCGLSSGASIYVGGGSVRNTLSKTASNKCKITCRNCKQNGLQWLQKDGGWRLYTNTLELHSCYKKPEKVIPTAVEVFKKSNYTFTLGSDEIRDWWKVSHKGVEIGRVLWNGDSWKMYAHAGIPDAVVSNIDNGFCKCLNEV